MRVEVPRTRVANVLKKLHKKERLLVILRPEPKVLVVAAGVLVIQVNVKKLARIPCLRNRVHEVQPGHVLVRNFRIDTHHFRMVQCWDKPKHGTGRG